MRRALLMSIGLFSLVIAIGTIGFTLVEPTLSNNYAQAFWLTVVTALTVGYGDIVPITDAGKALAVFIMISGIGAGIYTLTLFFQLAVTDRLRLELGLPARRIKMNDHYIICGYGLVGRQVIFQLQCKNEKFIVIENDRDKIEGMVEKGLNVIHGDAEDEETLLKANIATAKGLITTMRDSQNLVAIIAAKNLNPALYIVSEVEEDKNIAKLKRVGADMTINCQEMGARIMVDNVRHAVLDPVCSVEISTIKDRFEYDVDGIKMTFCSQECLNAFKKHPERFQKSWQYEEVCPVPRK